MNKRKRAQQEDPDAAAPETGDSDAWDAPDFRQSLIIDVVFVALPAIVMAALGEHAIAAAWISVGMLVIIYQFRSQIRSFLRSWRGDKQ